ncbi:MAG: glycogen debranching protein GlgX [Burkholderiales bacterium]
MQVGPGSPEPLGATPVAGGANVAVWSAHATAIELCVFDAAGAVERARIALPARTGDVWHGFVAGLAAGDRYGLRAHGPYAPHDGHRFNAAKLLVDPYARALDRRFALHPAMFGAGADDGVRDATDSAPFVPKAIVTPWPATAFARRPRVPWSETVVYELHVRGFTRLHPDVPEALRGTCAGLAHPAALAHLTRLGVTTVELMPLAAAIDERHLLELGLTNYWGYNPAALFVPEPRLAPGGMAEVRDCVAALHDAGFEVILDVVLNHTGEGDARGPTLSLRGLDNLTYYRTLAEDRARYADDTGCGHAVALDRPPALRLALDALRYWAQAAGVDGFRFDLGTTLGRRDDGFDPAAPLLQAIAQDPALRDLKMIAEPWDVGFGGYRLGAFPAPWGEWNDRFRDAARRFWRGDAGMVGELATRFAGSADVFAARTRPPSRSVNFVAAHDGFTLADLVAYATKHNEVNGEGNRDGAAANHAWNHGVEGPTADAAIAAARTRDVRNLLATLLLARGTPMLAMGDELGRTQHGNNNGYAQDNATTWLDWAHADDALAACTARLVACRRRHPALRADRWLAGAPPDDSGVVDVEWRHPDGRAMGDAWTDPDVRTLVAVVYAPATAAGAADRVAVALNAGDTPVTVQWPAPRAGFAWRACVDTSSPAGEPGAANIAAPTTSVVPPHAVVVVAEEALPDTQRAAPAALQEALDRLAAAAGIAGEWWDVGGTRHVVAPDTKRALLASMGLPTETRDDALAHLAALTAAKAAAASGAGTAERCHLPPGFRAGARRFGLAAHLYALRRDGDAGIGDFTTLARAAEATARAGGAVVGLNPLHALFAEDRERASPYHPSDRRFLDPIYVDVDAVADLAASADARALLDRAGPRIAGLAARADVDYAGVWEIKRAALAACFAAFERRAPTDPLVADFDAFVAAGGTSLARFALFEAIAAAHPRVPWQRWPDGLRAPDARGTAAFAVQHARAVRFALYLQWLADRQLATAAGRAREAGLALGYYRDLAVGAAPDGAEPWANPGAFARGASIGAPPDPFSPSGQVWCLPPPNPHTMRASGAAGFRELLAANMRHAGALRIDHVMGLSRLFWVPDGAAAVDGAYVDYPLALQLRVLAQQSAAARCVVVGEDLGTVPEGFREQLAATDVLSYRVLLLERDGTDFVPPARYPATAVACVSTHDLPTIAGWWSGADIDEKHALGLLTDAAAREARVERGAERAALAAALDRAGATPGHRVEPSATPDAELVAAIHRFVGAAPSILAMVQADDLVGATTALNLPTTDQARPNWRRRIGVDVDALWTTDAGVLTAAGLAERGGRGRG